LIVSFSSEDFSEAPVAIAALFSFQRKAAKIDPNSKNKMLTVNGPVGPCLFAVIEASCPAVIATKLSPTNNTG
jgi:hypothetical protein